jgi:Glu-tRNA(Gln) amidotransferase subunit E-like FAD-binding protein
MYPDTDSPPTRVTGERVAAIRARLRPAPWHRLERYLAARVPEETSRFLIRRGGAEILDAVVARTGADLLVAAVEIGQRARAMKRRGIAVERLGADEWTQVFDLFTGGRIPREGIATVAAAMARDGIGAEAAATAAGIALEPRARWQPEIERLAERMAPAGDRDAARRLRQVTGEAVYALRGRAPAREVAEALRARLEEVSR